MPAFVAEGAVIDEHAVRNVFIFDGPICIEAIFAFDAERIEIAIPRLAEMAVVIAVFAVKDRGSFARDYFLQFCELVKERAIEIKIATVIAGVPRISPPHGIFINRKRSIGRVGAYYFFAGRIAFSSIELPFISKDHKFAHAFFR